MRACNSTFFGKSLSRFIFAIKSDEKHLPKSGESLFELTDVQGLVAVEVHALKNQFEGTDAHATLLLNGQLELEVQFAHHHVHVHAVECHT